MLGVASGIFIVPILTMFGHIEIHTAVGASIVSVIACSCGGAAPFLKSRLTNIRLAIVLEIATTVGALTGVLLTGILPVSFLYFIFAVILFVSAHQMQARRGVPVPLLHSDATRWISALRLNASYPDSELRREVAYRVHRLPLTYAVLIFLCIGFAMNRLSNNAVTIARDSIDHSSWGRKGKHSWRCLDSRQETSRHDIVAGFRPSPVLL
jgi:uncharacterized membrane protein YfcA